MNWHNGRTIWFTGLSGSGKSTLSSMLKSILQSRGVPVVLLDGDVLRSGLNRDLGFSAADRAENIRRAGEVAKLFTDEGRTVLAAFITPLDSIRTAVRSIFEPGRYVEIFLNCPLSVCEMRDPKGLYCKARSGLIPEFTGISAPFEIPESPDLKLPTGEQTVEQSLDTILKWLESRFPDLALDCSPERGRAVFRKRVAVIGLDSVPPPMVFGKAAENLPNLRALAEHGLWGTLRSTDPPITIPAWATMTTGKDPGELGLYGFRNRFGHDYREMSVANASHVKAPRVWDYLETTGRSSLLIGIPQTYPPVPHNGITICGFPAPDGDLPHTYPPELAEEVSRLAGGSYVTDLKGFRTAPREQLLADIHAMMHGRFEVARRLLLTKPWDFFMMVETAPDRLHHCFWRYANPDHPGYDPDNPYEGALHDFYLALDAELGSLLALLDDQTTVFIVSDHGVRSMQGGVCINEWLLQNGYLHLKGQAGTDGAVTPDLVDWDRTTAWSEGGYYARIFLNVKGREPQGTIHASEYEQFRDGLAERLLSMKGEHGEPLANRVLKPEDLYQNCCNVPPDLIVYFDDLNRRSIGTVGHGKIFVAGNDRGADDANHDPDGIFIMTRMADLRSGLAVGKEVLGSACIDLTPTILHEYGLPIPEQVGGRIIHASNGEVRGLTRPPVTSAACDCAMVEEQQGYTPEEEEAIKKRLTELGYL
jgi:adenylyl-sulfate kinase